LFIAGLLWLVTVFSFSYILPSLFGNSEGSIFNYPLFTNKEELLSSGDYIVKTVYYSVCFIGFSIAILVFMGNLIRNTIINYLFVFLLFIGGLIVSNSGYNSFGNPFTYQNIDRVILGLPHFYPAGNAVLIAIMILSLLLTFFMNRKRGI